MSGLKNPTAFYNSLRAHLFEGPISQTQVNGIDAILTGISQADWPIAWAAYGFATAFWETNKTMEPVKEAYWLSEDWRRKNLRYYPWYGRGLVQTTWERNYQHTDDVLDLNGTLMKTPDLLLTLAVAVPALVHGMSEGWYSGRKLSDTLPRDRLATKEEFRLSRPIINGHDKDSTIADIAMEWQDALSPEVGNWA